jgi:two-component system chemotaxis response regulator CheY
MGLRGLRVLIVDDDLTIHRLLLDLLRFWSCEEVEAAMDGEEGVKKYEAFRPDLVLMDLDMPRMNGYEASRAIAEKDPNACIVLVTSHAESRYARQALKEGWVKVAIPKPFYLDQLHLAMEEALTKKPRSDRSTPSKGAVG